MADTDVRIDLILRALSDPTRRKLLEAIERQPGLTTADLARLTKGISRWGVMKHLATLQAAGLIQSMPEGRRTRHFSEPQALQLLRDWLAERPG